MVPITCGVPQGSNLGPLLFLVYINDLLNCLNHTTPRMFADDTSVRYASNSVEELENIMNSDLKTDLNSWLTTNRLSLNICKNRIGSRQKIRVIDGEMNIKINDNKINRVDFVKSLGLHFDEHLSWSVHIRKLCKKIASAIGALKTIRPFITTNTAIQVYQSLIQPHFDYCCSVWDGLGETLSCKIQKLQNRAVRIITRSIATIPVQAPYILNTLHLDRLFLRRKKLKAGLIFKTLKGNIPSYLQDFFQFVTQGTIY